MVAVLSKKVVHVDLKYNFTYGRLRIIMAQVILRNWYLKKKLNINLKIILKYNIVSFSLDLTYTIIRIREFGWSDAWNE